MRDLTGTTGYEDLSNQLVENEKLELQAQGENLGILANVLLSQCLHSVIKLSTQNFS